MSEMSEIIKSSFDGIKEFTDMHNVIGEPINTPAGVTVIPISKITVGFAGGGLDYGQKKLTQNQNFGGGSGTGMSITPLGFLTVGKNADVNLIPIGESSNNVDRIVSLIERSPDIIDRIKNRLS